MAGELDNVTVRQLAEPFEPSQIHWLPVTVKDQKALVVAYIEARAIMARLDQIVGPGNWATSYQIVDHGCVVCTLAVRVAGEWVAKSDVGSPSEQPNAGDKLKAAFSDAIKRAAVSWGIGRYLSRLPRVWVDYDPQRKQIRNPPAIPEWALPKKKAA